MAFKQVLFPTFLCQQCSCNV